MGFVDRKDTSASTEDGAGFCRLCGLPLSAGEFSNDYALCDGCLIQTNSFLKHEYTPQVEQWTQLADQAGDPVKKINCLRNLLDILYDYKVKYYDNGIDFIDGDVDDLIDSVVARIAAARG